MVETKTSKTNTLVIVAAIVVILLLLLVIAGNLFNQPVNTNTNNNPVSVPTNSSDDSVNSLLIFLTAIAFVSASIMAYYYFFNKNENFNNEIALAAIRNYAYKHCDRQIINDNFKDNMSVEFIGNSVFYYFKDINTTFRMDRDTRFISHNRIVLADAIRQIERSELLKNVVSGSSFKDVLLAELQRKGIDKSDAEKQISKIEGQMLSG